MSFRVVGIGEVLWDLLPSGPQLGGAPANFAFHAHELGAVAQVISRVGDDENGHEILRRFAGMGLPGGAVQMDDTAPTGTVTVALSGSGQPEFTIHENVAWDCIAITEDALGAVCEADAVCFGSLAQRREISRQTIQHLVAAAPVAAWRIFDINLRQRFFGRDIIARSLELANVLKLNDSELPVLAALFDLRGGLAQQLTTLAGRFNLKVIALTRGAQGSLLFQDGIWSECGTRPVEVKDTVGAGDAFTAGLALGLLAGMNLAEINRAAGEVARHVCASEGATPPLTASLRALFQ